MGDFQLIIVYVFLGCYNSLDTKFINEEVVYIIANLFQEFVNNIITASSRD